jgi:endonuclease-3
MAKAKPAQVEKLIKSINFFRNKAKSLVGAAKMLQDDFGGKIPLDVDEMTKLPGVGRKTAAIVLWAAYGQIEGLPVDTHVLRLALRLGLTKYHDQHKVERDLMNATPKKDWPKVNPLLISHGRAVCTARNRNCEACIFNKRCPSSTVLGKKDLAK